MKIVESGGRYTVFDEGLKVYDQLPPGYYEVNFGKLSGHFMTSHPGFKTIDKIYGKQSLKVAKILKSFEVRDDKLGVIFSGEKGTGKTLCLGVLAKLAIEQMGLPVIVVNKMIPDLAGYLSKFTQDAVVVFDEFEKVFKNTQNDDGRNAQEELLSMFDGVNLGKKLFIITCNNHRSLNSYMLNRPGRFHYHIQFKCPVEQEIREYLEDNVLDEYKDRIDDVIVFSRMAKLNYDCLHAIAFELNIGEEFSDAIKDINIVNTEHQDYDCMLKTDMDDMIVVHNYSLDLFSDYETIPLYDYNRNITVTIEINTRNISADTKEDNTLHIGVGDISIDNVSLRSPYSKEDKVEYENYIKEHMLGLTIKKSVASTIHYVRQATPWGVSSRSSDDLYF